MENGGCLNHCTAVSSISKVQIRHVEGGKIKQAAVDVAAAAAVIVAVVEAGYK